MGYRAAAIAGPRGLPGSIGGGIPGAAADGVTDDTTACQAALNAITGLGGTVDFGSGAYLVSACLNIKSGTRVVGGKAKIICPSAGWVLAGNGTNSGLMGAYAGVESISVSGMHFYGTKLADAANSPKLFYIQNSSNIHLFDNYFENTQFEGVFETGTQVLTKRINVSNNYFYNVGWPAAEFVGLPAIQMNASDVVIANNILIDVGTGIGPIGSGVISNNRINGITRIGIGINEGSPCTPCTISGNSIEMTSHASQVRIGIYLGGGHGSPASALTNVTGNSISLAGDPDDLASVCIHQDTCQYVLAAANSCEITGSGRGFYVVGTADGSYSFMSDNVVHYIDEDGGQTSYGFLYKAGGVGNELTIVSSGNKVIGISEASYAFNIGTQGGGTIIEALNINDFKTGGQFSNGSTYFTDHNLVPLNYSYVP